MAIKKQYTDIYWQTKDRDGYEPYIPKLPKPGDNVLNKRGETLYITDVFIDRETGERNTKEHPYIAYYGVKNFDVLGLEPTVIAFDKNGTAFNEEDRDEDINLTSF